MNLLRVFITAPVSIAVLFILSKLIGNKQIANLTMFDYVNGITIGSIAAEMATVEFDGFFNCLLALVIYAAAVILMSVLSQKSLVLRRFLTGKSILLYDRGKLYRRNFKAAKLDMNELLTMLRDKGYFCLDDVEAVFLEQTGSVSVLPKENKRPVTPEDLKLRVHQTRPEIVVIYSGRVLEENLKATGNNREWLSKELKNLNKKAEEIFTAVCDGSGNLKVYNCSDKVYKNDLFE